MKPYINSKEYHQFIVKVNRTAPQLPEKVKKSHVKRMLDSYSALENFGFNAKNGTKTYSSAIF